MAERNTSIVPLLRSLVNSMSPKVEPVRLDPIDLLHKVDNMLAAAQKDPIKMEAHVRTARYTLMRALTLLENEREKSES